MDNKEKVLAAIKEAGTPVNVSKIVELTGMEKKDVEKAMKILKESGAIVSPKRCYWEVAQ
ncbi:MAG: MarR family transcriptional regulator [Bacteroidaceae bacterium]|nr:MarR family transcriptional regulator [Bacteroidaceae bacterium]